MEREVLVDRRLVGAKAEARPRIMRRTAILYIIFAKRNVE